MQAGWVFFYFVLACTALALLIFPELRRMPVPHWRVLRDAMWRPLHARRRASALKPWQWMVCAGIGLLLPALAVVGWSLHAPRQLDGFEDRTAPANEQVTWLLQGEHLVPPPPLPPDVFLTAEVEAVRPMLSTADRRWDKMDADFVQRLLQVFHIMKTQHGYEMALLEGHRSPERQAMLAARGAHVTMAGAWQSYHQYGLASDCAFYRDGKLVISEKDPWAMRGYQLYGQVAEQLGLTWGGRWQMMDLGHVEWRKPGVRRDAGGAGTPR
ncbi:MAG: M15 family metallopeptidase [Aquabacterium sp.]